MGPPRRTVGSPRCGYIWTELVASMVLRHGRREVVTDDDVRVTIIMVFGEQLTERARLVRYTWSWWLPTEAVIIRRLGC
jgi:hypothetical protein